jgi:pyridoxine 5-phosphate synthase
MAELGGADQITVHLREDRRHIQDRDVEILLQTCKVRLNLECAVNDQMIANACRLRPHQVCLVPERREEITTEGGLNVELHQDAVSVAIQKLRDAEIFVSLFLDPNPHQIEAARQLSAQAVELHTGAYANAVSPSENLRQLELLESAAKSVIHSGLSLHAGHGLNYINVVPIAQINGMQELNIGHSIISRAIFVGLERAVREMKALIVSGSNPSIV